MKINRNLDHKKIWFNSMVGMTWGFLATLVVGTIIGLFGIYSKKNIFIDIKNIMTFITPIGIGIGVGFKAKLSVLQILGTSIGTFIVGQSLFVPEYNIAHIFDFKNTHIGINITKIYLPGDVFGAWIIAVLFVYIFNIFIWKSFFDIMFVPLFSILIGIIGSFSITFITSSILVIFEWIIDHTIMSSYWAAILLAPFIGALMGLALSLPTSSVAIVVALHLSGYAATAAIAGTSAQMITFAVMTYYATGSWTKTLAVGVGSSMLHMNNFIRKPKILILPILISSFSALVAVIAFDLPFPNVNPTPTSGMGTSVLYGQIFTLHDNGWTNKMAYLFVFVIELALPLISSIFLSHYIFKKQWIKKTEMELYLE